MERFHTPIPVTHPPLSHTARVMGVTLTCLFFPDHSHLGLRLHMGVGGAHGPAASGQGLSIQSLQSL